MMRPLALLLIASCLLGCGGDTMEVWHTASLDAEFSVDKLDTVSSFDDYLELEQELFKQLDEEVYGETPTGSQYTLVRYSSGSAADFRGHLPDWNRSRELVTENPRGTVLLLHGMSDSPYSLRSLGESLQVRGFHVLSLRLPGHGTAPVGLTRVTAEDMQAATGLAVEHLLRQFPHLPLHIVGYSTGAPLALDYALDAAEGKVAVAPASLILISPAIGVSAAAGLAKWKRRLSLLPGLSQLAWLNIEPEFDPYKYNSFATNAGEQVYRLTERVARRIAAWDGRQPQYLLPPTLVLKSTVDATVSNQAVIDRLLRKLSPQRHELVLFDINRANIARILLVNDPGPHTGRLMADDSLPFDMTLVTNRDEQSRAMVARHKPARSTEITATEELDIEWPPRVVSLSHVALPFAADDPLYGQNPTGDEGELFLGQLGLQGERGLLRLSSDWLLRIRSNPFYDYLERRVIDWVEPL
jgi:pimeloyl-ACP methyl ester carboxylesterase